MDWVIVGSAAAPLEPTYTEWLIPGVGRIKRSGSDLIAPPLVLLWQLLFAKQEHSNRKGVWTSPNPLGIAARITFM